MKHLVSLILFAGLGMAQPFRWAYVEGSSITGTSAKWTLQIASNSARTARLLAASITCPAACDITITRGGTMATSTAGTIRPTRTDAPAPGATFWTASNSTGGTALPTEPGLIPKTVLDLEDIEIKPGEAVSITVTSGSSQTVTMNLKHEEYER